MINCIIAMDVVGVCFCGSNRNLPTDAIGALPGSIGTLDELFDALAQKKLGLINCHIGVLDVNGFFDPLFELLQNSRNLGFTSEKAFATLKSGKTPEELFQKF